MLPEFKQSSGNFNTDAFKEFFNSMVNYIFKNSALLSSMKDSVKDLVANFEDLEMLQNIAENFARKKDYTNSEDIYKRILEIDPENDKASRKSKHFLAMRDPGAVSYEDLPPITLVTESEKLRQLEMDFLHFTSLPRALTRASSSLSLIKAPKSSQVLQQSRTSPVD